MNKGVNMLKNIIQKYKEKGRITEPIFEDMVLRGGNVEVRDLITKEITVPSGKVTAKVQCIVLNGVDFRIWFSLEAEAQVSIPSSTVVVHPTDIPEFNRYIGDRFGVVCPMVRQNDATPLGDQTATFRVDNNGITLVKWTADQDYPYRISGLIPLVLLPN
jgi:hypothetical protein